MGRGGPIAWSATGFKPDLICFMGPFEVYRVCTTIEQLRERIKDGCRRTREMPGIFERVRQSMDRRLEQCVGVNGGQIEPLLQRIKFNC